MNIFIKGLFIDNFNRLEKMIAILDNLSMEHPIASDFKKIAIRDLKKLRDRVGAIRQSGILDQKIFTKNALIKYNSINNEFLEIELFRFVPITKYDSKADGYFQKLIAKIYSETDIAQPVPFISTISNSESYYFAYPKYNMIGLPQGEEKYLLNLSDLYHEIGHLIYQRSNKYLTEKYIPFVEKYFDDLIASAKKESDNGTFLNLAEHVKELHTSSWAEEFACDLIGAYFVGPAYAWTNMKICASKLGNAIFSGDEIVRVHPPDEARMRVILKMITVSYPEFDMRILNDAWSDFIKELKPNKPANYDVLFTQEMIQNLTENVLEGCRSMTFKSYKEQLVNFVRPTSLIINEAWDFIRSNPDDFINWEENQIIHIIKDL